LTACGKWLVKYLGSQFKPTLGENIMLTKLQKWHLEEVEYRIKLNSNNHADVAKLIEDAVEWSPMSGCNDCAWLYEGLVYAKLRLIAASHIR